MNEAVSPPAEFTVIHPSAVIARGAEIGSGVQIGPFCAIGANVVIGDGVELVSHVVIDGHTHISSGVKLYPFSSIGLAPQDIRYKDEPTRCVIGARSQIREHCSIHRGTPTGLGVTTVGTDCILMAVTHVAHDCTLGNGVIVANNVVMGGHVWIGDNAIIGGQSAIHQFTRIGRGAMIGGVTGVEADVVPFGMVVGNRGLLTGLNVIGLTRLDYERPRIHRLRAAFRLLFAGKSVFAERLVQIRAQFADEPLVTEMLAFIDQPSKRGLIHASLSRDQEGK